MKNHWVHRNIKIRNNVFKVFGTPILAAKSTKGILFENNVIQSSSFRPADASVASFKFEHCADIVLKNNAFELSTPIQITYNKMQKGDIKAEKGMELRRAN